MSFKFHPRLEQLEEYVAPASFSFLLPTGETENPEVFGTGQFTMPTEGVDPALASQAIPLNDMEFTISASGTPGSVWEGGSAVDPNAVANFEYGVFVGVSTSVAFNPFITYSVSDNEITTEGYAYLSASVVYDAADTRVTFTLPDGTVGAISYDIPWDSVDATQASQNVTPATSS